MATNVRLTKQFKFYLFRNVGKLTFTKPESLHLTNMISDFLYLHVVRKCTTIFHRKFYIDFQILNMQVIYVSCRREPLAGSTRVHGPTAGDSFSLLCLIIRPTAIELNPS